MENLCSQLHHVQMLNFYLLPSSFSMFLATSFKHCRRAMWKHAAPILQFIARLSPDTVSRHTESMAPRNTNLSLRKKNVTQLIVVENNSLLPARGGHSQTSVDAPK